MFKVRELIAHGEKEASSRRRGRGLRQVDQLTAEGKTQSKIARILNISVMTLHRWRNVRAQRVSLMPVSSTTLGSSAPTGKGTARSWRKQVAELQSENGRLRRLVTDLLLEKVVLQDEFQRACSRPADKKHPG